MFICHGLYSLVLRSYGGKSKDTNEAIYDAFPLKNLVKLLCFEDEDEARAACKHFNIAVNSVKVRTSSGSRTEEIVFWRHSSFREPKDENKGTVVSLRPQKMVRTIEAKLNGATRLAVCRGEQSADISSSSTTTTNEANSVESPHLDVQIENESLSREQDTRRIIGGDRLVEEISQRKKQRDEDEARHKLEMEKERIRKEKQIRLEKQEEERRMKRIMEEEKRKAEEQERLRLQRIEEMRQQEVARMKADEMRRQERERQEEERKRRDEIARKKQEEERQKRELADKKRKMAEEQQRMIRIAEARRLEMDRQRRERERRELEERREAEEWNKAVNAAREKLSFLRWVQKFPTHLRLLDETNARLKNLGHSKIPIATPNRHTILESKGRRGIRSIVESLLRKSQPRLFNPASTLHKFVSPNQDQISTCMLYRFAVVLPYSDESLVLSLLALIQTWIATTLDFGTTHVAKSTDGETRVVFVDGNEPGVVDSCDGILIVAPCIQGVSLTDSIDSLELALTCDLPRVGLLLIESIEGEVEIASRLLETRLSDSSNEMFIIANALLDEDSVSDSLSRSIESLAQEVRSPKRIERMSLEKLCSKCLKTVVWAGEYDKRDDVIVACREALAALVGELASAPVGSGSSVYRNWPGAEFADPSNSVVSNYFGSGLDLPLNWAEITKGLNVKCQLTSWVDRMDGPLPVILRRLLVGAPDGTREECRVLAANRFYRRSLEVALLWKSQAFEPWEDEIFVYLPVGSFDEVVSRVCRKVAGLALPHLLMIDSANATLMDGGGTGDVINWPAPTPKRQLLLANTKSPKRSQGVTPPTTVPASKEQLDEIGQLAGAPVKRRKLSENREASEISTELRQSADFTKRLQAIVGGEYRDRMIGTTPMSALLRGSPKPELAGTSPE